MGIRKKQGNTLVLVLVSIGFVTALLAYFSINFAQLMASHKEAQTAIDAAALQAAKDMGRVVVDSPLGRMALVDDPSGNSAWPVLGANTVLATLRLDALIASKLGNKSITYMVQTDLANTQKALQLLNQKLVASANGQGGAYDRDGQAVNIKQNAYDAYLANNRRLTNTTEAPRQFTISIGRLNDPSGKSATLIPVPNPENQDVIAFGSTNSSLQPGGQKYYRPDIDYPVPGTNSNIRFGWVKGQSSLATSGIFVLAQGIDVPVAAQVVAHQPVKQLVKDKSKGTDTEELRIIASTAVGQVGNRALLPNSGVLEVAFPGGMPAKTNGGPDFTSVKSIMNASQLDPSQPNPTSPYTGWNKDTPGNWFKAQGGPVWGSGSIVPTNFKGMSQRSGDDPSVALSFFVYDWLRSMHYRPSVDSVVTALQKSFQDSLAYGTGSPRYAMQPAFAQSASSGITTGILTVLPGTLGINGISFSGYWAAKDPRGMGGYQDNPEAYQRQQARMWGYVPADGVLPAGTALMSVHPDGNVTTTNGKPWWHMDKFIERLKATNSAAVIVYQGVTDIVADTVAKDAQIKEMMGQLSPSQKQRLANEELAQTYKQAQLPEMSQQVSSSNTGVVSPPEDLVSKIQMRKQAVTSKLYKEKPKLLAALINATYAFDVTNAMMNNMKVITGGGVEMATENDFVLDGQHFYPSVTPYPVGYTMRYGIHDWHLIAGGSDWGDELAYVKAALLNEKGTLPTGQPASAPGVKDWLADPKNVGGKPVSQMSFFSHNTLSAISRNKPQSSVLAPAYAQETAPAQKFTFDFKIDPNSRDLPAGSQKVMMEVSKINEFSKTPTSEGQVLYQTVDALSSEATSSPNSEHSLAYQVQGRDLHANAYPESTGQTNGSTTPPAVYFDKGLVASWAITCPIVVPNPAPPAPKVEMINTVLLWCDGGGQPGQHSAWSVVKAYGYPFIFSTIVPNDGTINTPWGIWTNRRYGGVQNYPPLPPAYVS